MEKFTNAHIHVFTGDCAPDSFLKVIPISLVRKFPRRLKWLIQTRGVRSLIVWFASWGSRRDAQLRNTVEKYISFLEIGTTATQLEIFIKGFKVAKSYSASPRIVALPLDMDYMDEDQEIVMNYNTQLKDVKRIKKYYPDNFFPFLCVDPRKHQGENMLRWARKFFTRGIRSKESEKVHPFFSGIKIYPALGFFPFDPALDELYAFAEEHGLPVMSHCTRVGSQYVGKNIRSLIPQQPAMIGVPGHPDYEQARQEIIDRIARYDEKGWLKYTTAKNNDYACDLFGHPQNYVPVLLKYPRLKICLAHMGGYSEILKLKKGPDEVQEVDQKNWFGLIKEMMQQYPNFYTDISYTLSGLQAHKKLSRADARFIRSEINAFLDTPVQSTGEADEPIGKRVLFGTDFYMTEQEAREPELYQMAREHLPQWFKRMAGENCERYLGF
mgnify:CR=1 FL=1